MSENIFDDMRLAVQHARSTFNAADNQADAMARMLDGRLRHCGPTALAALKKQLRNFNIHTGRWNTK